MFINLKKNPKNLNSKIWTQTSSVGLNSFPLKIRLSPCGTYTSRWEPLI